MHNSKNILSLYLIQSFLFTYLCIYADYMYKHIFHGIVNAIKSHIGLYFTAIPSFESVKSGCLTFFLINKSIKYVLQEIMINWFFFSNKWECGSCEVWELQLNVYFVPRSQLLTISEIPQTSNALLIIKLSQTIVWILGWKRSAYLTISNQGVPMIIMNLSMSKHFP